MFFTVGKHSNKAIELSVTPCEGWVVSMRIWTAMCSVCVVCSVLPFGPYIGLDNLHIYLVYPWAVEFIDYFGIGCRCLLRPTLIFVSSLHTPSLLLPNVFRRTCNQSRLKVSSMFSIWCPVNGIFRPLYSSFKYILFSVFLVILMWFLTFDIYKLIISGIYIPRLYCCTYYTYII